MDTSETLAPAGGKAIVVNNVDDSSECTSQFLTAMGLENWVSQFEMVYNRY